MSQNPIPFKWIYLHQSAWIFLLYWAHHTVIRFTCSCPHTKDLAYLSCICMCFMYVCILLVPIKHLYMYIGCERRTIASFPQYKRISLAQYSLRQTTLSLSPLNSISSLLHTKTYMMDFVTIHRQPGVGVR